MDFLDNKYAQILTSSPVIKILVTAVTIFIMVFLLRKLLRTFFSKASFIEARKVNTLEAMMYSLINYAAVLSFIFIVLSEWIEIGRILAGAGVLGLIIGFGAQSLIKDFFSGLFLLYEKQLHKGDFITLNDKFHGTVEDIGLRFLKIREWSGKLLTISNGQITTIENYNFEHMRVIEHVTTTFNEDPRKVVSVLEEACVRLNEELHEYLLKDLKGDVVEPFQVYGMSSLNHEHRGYQYTVTGLVQDLVYWTASKETRYILAEAMYDHQIAMAEQRVQVNANQDKDLL
ncbi:putative MscS family protein YfkC [Halobacillus andaensis]|uniref:MscS family protein YfkC n=1 Tax=Halobacillus andaensis TaxID=1176239 RepID=A0A917B647_HALAA|nr:mechanosensitive ion channel domain-containing protein [Halobacillus andaensis]MBP2005963.1 small conductance mechanosensitive channel [Halobacillus andaensis]GGF24695.1 putative MscS family protein YfkC [Halobacillus andaensis]